MDIKFKYCPDGKKIAMIKELRGLFGCGLREAKDFVETMLEHNSNTFTVPADVLNATHQPTLKWTDSQYFELVSGGKPDVLSDTVIPAIRSLVAIAMENDEFQLARDLIAIMEVHS